ncbi:hypothetical protein [uncultured Alistipes sp.]|uniref:hypothetical protein n=1 Tax=uncultured Alistipes sp. TaxID=538949 RepID=UPI00261E126F|nr:hypothetical protein [uncultured Alistipes sp.]
MKKMLFAVAALCAVLAVCAQEPSPFQTVRPDSLRDRSFSLPDSLSYLSPWREEYRKIPREEKKRPAVSMTSIVVVGPEEMPKRISVLDNNTLRLTPHFTIGNGQAWNWSPYPDAYLDARTLSFPLPR